MKKLTFTTMASNRDLLCPLALTVMRDPVVVPEGYIADKNAYSAMLQLRYQRGAREVSDSLVISPTKQSHDHTSQYHDSIRASLTNCKAAPTPLLERIEQFWSQHPYCPRLDLQEDTLLLTLQLRCNIDPPFQAAILGPETPTPVNAPWLQPSALLLNYLTRRHTDTITPASFDVSTFLAHLHPKLAVYQDLFRKNGWDDLETITLKNSVGEYLLDEKQLGMIGLPAGHACLFMVKFREWAQSGAALPSYLAPQIESISSTQRATSLIYSHFPLSFGVSASSHALFSPSALKLYSEEYCTLSPASSETVRPLRSVSREFQQDYQNRFLQISRHLPSGDVTPLAAMFRSKLIVASSVFQPFSQTQAYMKMKPDTLSLFEPPRALVQYDPISDACATKSETPDMISSSSNTAAFKLKSEDTASNAAKPLSSLDEMLLTLPSLSSLISEIDSNLALLDLGTQFVWPVPLNTVPDICFRAQANINDSQSESVHEAVIAYRLARAFKLAMPRLSLQFYYISAVLLHYRPAYSEVASILIPKEGTLSLLASDPARHRRTSHSVDHENDNDVSSHDKQTALLQEETKTLVDWLKRLLKEGSRKQSRQCLALEGTVCEYQCSILEAFEHYTAAAKLGNASALSSLALLHEPDAEKRAVSESSRTRHDAIEKSEHKARCMLRAAVDWILQSNDPNQAVDDEDDGSALSNWASHVYITATAALQRISDETLVQLRRRHSLVKREPQTAASEDSMLKLKFETVKAAVERLLRCVPLLHAHAALRGCISAVHELGFCFEIGVGLAVQPSAAFECYCIGARCGLVVSVGFVGDSLFQGLGCIPDAHLGRSFAVAAARAGDLASMNLLGAIGLYGATAVNLGPAWADGIHWYERSAEQDNDREETTDALFELGYFYDAVVEYQTEPLEELNLSTAAAGYFTRAAERGCAGAMHSLALLQRRMQNIPDSLYWSERGAELNHARCAFEASMYHSTGTGTAPDKQKAFDYLLLAYHLSPDDPDVLTNLACMLKRGDGCRIDADASFTMYQQAAKLGCPRAQTQLGIMLRTRPNNIATVHAAIDWWKRAAQLNYRPAAACLAATYRTGVPQLLAADAALAAMWSARENQLLLAERNAEAPVEDRGAAPLKKQKK